MAWARPWAWPAADNLIYARVSVPKKPGGRQQTEYFSLDPTAPTPQPVPLRLPRAYPRAARSGALVPAEIREAWTGFFQEWPHGWAALFSTSVEGYSCHVLHILHLQAGACGVIGPGGQAAWSPAPVAGQ